ncbi:hypothetical protein NLJ89_g5450 [Agrocybe chaxingu]|uniref:Uncharacterized protein n=1 Tax=Agrocybe chaxingu TaxID=84603 RepID=A0A9W8K0R8_9AGAR|nr:hypothetical protein NLJ89_g5450 [Agrocybe chaxingu]
MAPQKKKLPPGVEEHPTKKEYARCTVCLKFDPTSSGNWMKRSSVNKHVDTSETHKRNLARDAECEAERLANEAHLRALADAPALPAQLDNILQRIQMKRRQAMFEDTGPESTGPSDHFSADVDENHSPASAPPLIPANIQPLVHDEVAKEEELLSYFNQLLSQAQHNDFVESTEEDFFDDVIEDLEDGPDLRTGLNDQDILNQFDNIKSTSDYFPYPNKTMMLLDIMDNLPRLRVSSSLMRVFLWILKESGVPGTPSYDRFRAMQKHLCELCGTLPTAHESLLGNVFYVNDICQSIAMDFANPEVSKHLHFYPEETNGPIVEVWQAQRWKEYKPSQLTPMYANGLRHFYIEEVAQLEDGTYVIPHDWVIRNGSLSARCSIVHILASDLWEIKAGVTEVISASQFRVTCPEILDKLGGGIPWTATSDPPVMPNPLRKLANGKPLYVIMVPLWCDDVSGNRSKQYNKHMNMYTVNSNIPGQLLQQEYFVRFVSASPNATAPEQFSVLRDQVNGTQTSPIECYNAHTKEECAVILQVPGLPADNPQQSEESSHMGGNANCGCRKCKAGGSHQVTESDEGYHALYSAGVPRNVQETKNCLQKQLDLACRGVRKNILDLQTETGTKDKITEHWIDIIIKKAQEIKQAQPGLSTDSMASELCKWLDDQPGDKYNPLLDIPGLDPTQDTPVEILHTILLGIVKYVWHMVNVSWTDADRAIFAIRLQATDLDGLTVPPLRAAYMIQYRNGLIGKHFKTLMQTMAFHLHGIISPAQFELVKAVGALGSVLWVHEIDDMKQYLADLRVLIANVLDAFAALDPAKIILKIKLHILAHLDQDIERYGPAIRNSTEIFEGFNGVFRLCSVYSNHQAPSRDIAMKFCSMDRLKHFLSGGYWKEGRAWVKASDNVLKVLQKEPIIQRHLGWVSQPEKVPGEIRMAGRAKNPAVCWTETQASKVNNTFGEEDHVQWRKGISFIAQSGDICRDRSWVFFKDKSMTRVGRISEIVKSEAGTPKGLVTIEIFLIANCLHEEFGLPFLRRPPPSDPIYLVVSPLDVLFLFSVQHDCRLAKCEASTVRHLTQERQETGRNEKAIKHNDDSHFIINTFAIHNGSLLRNILPRELAAPRPLEADRQEYHAKLAAQLRVTQTEKRSRTQEKRRQTTAANKAKRKRILEEREDDSDGDDSDSTSESDVDEMEVVEEEQRPQRKRQRRR